MLSEARFVPGGEDERLRAVFGPLGRVVEGRRVPDDFVHELGEAHGVGVGAGAA